MNMSTSTQTVNVVYSVVFILKANQFVVISNFLTILKRIHQIFGHKYDLLENINIFFNRHKASS